MPLSSGAAVLRQRPFRVDKAGMRQRGALSERTARVVAIIVGGISLAFGGTAGLLSAHPRLRLDLARDPRHRGPVRLGGLGGLPVALVGADSERLIRAGLTSGT